jgi:glutamate racemase
MMKSIAVFDSGIGGITFLRMALRHLPSESFIYFADTDHVPYGIKSDSEVRRYVGEAVEFLVNKGIKALVLACNAATSVAITDLRQRYDFPIIGMEPAVKPALDYAGTRKVLVLSTSLTARGQKLRTLIDQLGRENQIVTMPCDELVCAAEAFDFESPKVKDLIRIKLDALDMKQLGAVVLGCTHFIYYRGLIASYLPPEVRIFDGNRGTLRNLMNKLSLQKSKCHLVESVSENREIVFYTSGRIPEDRLRMRLLSLALSETTTE